MSVARPEDPRGREAGAAVAEPTDLVAAVRRYFEARHHVRRGICHLNAGTFAEAAREFTEASEANPQGDALASYLAPALRGNGSQSDDTEDPARVLERRPDDVDARIRHALSMWKSGRSRDAIASLRDGLKQNPEAAELHFQLATLLGACEEAEEAELRFTQAVALCPDHADALVGLAMCEAGRHSPRDALKHLQRAQRLRPGDARVNLLLTMAVQAAGEQRHSAPMLAAMPGPDAPEPEAVEELSRVIEAEPGFVDAFLSLPASDVDGEVFELLAATLKRALRRQPELADLHYHCGRVLARLGRRDEAIDLTERAVVLDPKFVKALIHLAKLYMQTDRLADAMTRLEESLRLGAESRHQAGGSGAMGLRKSPGDQRGLRGRPPGAGRSFGLVTRNPPDHARVAGGIRRQSVRSPRTKPATE
jgi:tetratricopeptide (TPR) repeat protein